MRIVQLYSWYVFEKNFDQIVVGLSHTHPIQQIDNYRLEPMQTESRFAMNQFVLDGNKWKLSELQTKITWANNKEQNVLQNTIFTDLKNEMERGAFQKVVDFEEHVDHLPLNFTNPEII